MNARHGNLIGPPITKSKQLHFCSSSVKMHRAAGQTRNFICSAVSFLPLSSCLLTRSPPSMQICSRCREADVPSCFALTSARPVVRCLLTGVRSGVPSNRCQWTENNALSRSYGGHSPRFQMPVVSFFLPHDPVCCP